NLSELDNLLAQAAEAEQQGRYRRSAVRIVATVRAETTDDAETARDIMAECGGRDLAPTASPEG
ncbi:MAG TPA: hypothetical protein PLY10_11400, partial [Bacillota bacterium]|nr:hypothetical protein [Bacillota bacterium]